MARHLFGLTPSDWTFTVSGDGVTPQLAGPAVVTFWNAIAGGTQYTDLNLAPDGSSPVTSVTSSDGSDGYIVGQILSYYGPDGVRSMYIDGGTGSRLLVTCVDDGDDIDDHEIRIEALENQIDNMVNLLKYAVLRNPETDGDWPDRPEIAVGRLVLWVGGDNPSSGGTGMAEGDIFIDTTP